MNSHSYLSKTLLQVALGLSSSLACAEDQLTITTHPEAATDRGMSIEKMEVFNQAGGAYFIDPAAYKERKANSLADTFRYVPGVFSNSNDGSGGVALSVRGSGLDTKGYDMNGVRILEDGLPITTADGRNHNRLPNPLSAQYATFYRGPSALEYGASVLGGAVNVVSPTAFNSPEIQAYAMAGSHGYANLRGGAGQVLDNGYDFYITADLYEWDGYREHNEQSRQSVYANLGKQYDEISTRFYLSVQNSENELPGSLSKDEVDDDFEQANANAERGDFQKNVESYRLANKTTWDLSDQGRLDAGIAFEHQDMFHPIVANALPFFGGLIFEEDAQDLSAFIRYQRLVQQHDTLYGINYGVSDVTLDTFDNNDGTKGSQTETSQRDASSLEIYAVDRWSVSERVVLQLAVQWSLQDREIKDRDAITDAILENPEESYSSLNPRIGLVYSLSDEANVYGNMGRVFEAPTLSQLADEGASGDETLDAMTGLSFEIGVRGKQEAALHKSWTWDLTLYYAAISDEILSVENPSSPGTAITGNVDETIHSGIEMALTGQLPVSADAHLDAKLSATLNNVHFDDHDLYGDNDLPGAPSHFMRAECLYRHSGGWYVGPTLDYVSKRYVDFDNNYEVDDYVLFGLVGGYATDKWRVFGEIRNIFDQEHISTTSIRDDVVDDTTQVLNPGEPLSFYLGIEAQW